MDEQGLVNLRLMMRAVTLRRSKVACEPRRRIEEVVSVALSQTERHHYTSIRSQARTFLRTGARTSSINLLSFIVRLRQVCSHGILGNSCGPVPAAFALNLGSVIKARNCSKCGDALPLEAVLRGSFESTCIHQLCSECAFDQDLISARIDDVSISKCSLCESVLAEPRLDLERASSASGDDDLDVDGDETCEPQAKRSSKIDKVMKKLVELEYSSPNAHFPVKR